MQGPNALADHTRRGFQTCVTSHDAWDLSATLSDHSYTGTTTSPPKKIQNLCSQHSFPGSVLTCSLQSEKYLNELQGCTLQMQLAW